MTVDMKKAEKFLVANVDKMSLVEQVTAYATLKRLVVVAEAQMEALHVPLEAVTESKGTKTEAGHRTYDVDDTNVTVEHRREKLPGGEAMQDLLKEKGIQVSEVFDTVKSLVLNASKLDFLVQTGKLQQTDVDAIRKEKLALRVYPSKPLTEQLDGFLPAPKKSAKKAA